MFKDFILAIKHMFRELDHYPSAEAYIVSHSPQDIHDVDRLQRQYDEMIRRRYTNFYHE
jgi:hypothetical protein